MKLLLAITLVVLPSVAAAAPLSMSEFLALKPEWEELAQQDKPLRIEGRVASAAPQLLRLRNCPLSFRPATGVLPDVRRSPAVEIVGLLQRRAGELIFLVTELRERPDDRQAYALKESALNASDAGDWYELAAWAAGRGSFYKDQFLLDKASEARRRALALEREAAATDPLRLAALAKKAEEFQLADAKHELTHAALRLAFQQERDEKEPDFGPLIEEIKKLLPGAATPLEKWPADLATRYAAEPLAVYDAAEPAQRPALDRLLFAEVQLAAIERTADPDGANGESIAVQIANALPERAALAEQYREREIDYRMQRITTATRSEALELAKRLEQRERPDEARQALTAWLAAREAAQRKDGPSGLIAVAEDYSAVRGDMPAAARLLIEALQANPESETIPPRLRQLGFTKIGDEWLSKEEAAARPVDPVLQAMREGRVAVGMSPEQVRKTLGMPDRIARAASTSQIHDAWISGERDRSGIVVHFLRYSARAAEDGRVVGVATLAR